MNEKFLVVSSVTLAIRAKSEFDKFGIRCKIEKIKDYKVGGGCAFGIRVLESDIKVCVKILKNIHIKPVGIIDCSQNIL